MVISSSNLHTGGGSTNLFTVTFQDGVSAPGELPMRMRRYQINCGTGKGVPRTGSLTPKCIFAGENMVSSCLTVIDFEKFARLAASAHSHGVP